MRKVVFAINSSIDGSCGHLDMGPDDEVLGFFTELLRSASLALFGRVTYQLMVPFWPDLARNESAAGPAKEFARVFDSLEKIVFSTTLNHVEGDTTRILRGGLAEELLAMRQQPGRDIFVDSLSLASQLAEQGLIDEYHLVIHPVIVGKAPRLFERARLPEGFRLDLVGMKSFQSGIIALHYAKHAS